MCGSYPYVCGNSSEVERIGIYVLFEGKEFPDVFHPHPELRPKWADRHFWARGYYVATVGNVNEETIRNYIREQEENDRLEDGIKKQ